MNLYFRWKTHKFLPHFGGTELMNPNHSGHKEQTRTLCALWAACVFCVVCVSYITQYTVVCAFLNVLYVYLQCYSYERRCTRTNSTISLTYFQASRAKAKNQFVDRLIHIYRIIYSICFGFVFSLRE